MAKVIKKKLNAVKIKKVPIMLDKERTLYFDFNSFIELEEIYGSVEEAFKAMQGQNLKAIRALIWAGLIHEDPTITQRQVGAMLDFEKMETLTEALDAAIGESLPPEDKNQKNV